MSVKAWLLAIIRNKSLNLIRSQSRLDVLTDKVPAGGTPFDDIEFLDTLPSDDDPLSMY